MTTTNPTKLLSTIAILFLAVACQEDTFEATEEVDQDMLNAVALSKNYLNASNARGSDRRASVTVLRYIQGSLFFDTNTDDHIGYQRVEETTITAYAEPGEFIFWYSGEGVSDLDDIDFDDFSEDVLGDDLPDEIDPNYLWVVQIPESVDDSAIQLKYDIVYDYDGNSGSIIRLDPKIQIIGKSSSEMVSGAE